MRKGIVAAAAALVVVLGFAVWYAVSTYRELETNLQTEKQRSSSLSQELRTRTRALDRTKSEAEIARERAELASREAEEKSELARSAEEAARAAEEQRQQADQAKQHAEQAKQQAEQTARKAQELESRARTELAELHQRRESELNRMQEALSKIAPTRRTTSGMIIELASDSFYFDFNKAALRPENREILSRIAGVLLASEGYRLFVDGHTDDTGPDDYNKQLSLQRAASVADYLKEAGVPEDLMRVQGFGKSSPRVKNDSAPARQKNRRVEIGIVDTIIEYKEYEPGA